MNHEAGHKFKVDQLVDYRLKAGHRGQRWSCFAGQMAVWLRWILGLITPPISPRLPA